MNTLPIILNGEDKSSSFANCLRNHYRHLRKWAKRTSNNAFRLYDREVPHFPIAIDFYAGRYCIHYFSSKREQEEPSESFQQEIEAILKNLFGASREEIFWRIRAKHKETRQYEKRKNSQEFFEVLEYGVKFKINLTDYLDTGLFLDHRETRRLVALQAKGKRLLNLFAYTCSFSVQAAMAGACYTKSVDMSNTYTAWGRDNFELNHLPAQNHPIVRADCLKFLDQEIHSQEEYDLIIIDPPTISRSTKMDQLFDLQADYPLLLSKGLKLLAPRGTLFFSTNSRKLVFDPSLFPSHNIKEISEKTRPIDFRDPKIHRCWQFQ